MCKTVIMRDGYLGDRPPGTRTQLTPRGDPARRISRSAWRAGTRDTANPATQAATLPSIQVAWARSEYRRHNAAGLPDTDSGSSVPSTATAVRVLLARPGE